MPGVASWGDAPPQPLSITTSGVSKTDICTFEFGGIFADNVGTRGECWFDPDNKLELYFDAWDIRTAIVRKWLNGFGDRLDAIYDEEPIAELKYGAYFEEFYIWSEERQFLPAAEEVIETVQFKDHEYHLSPENGAAGASFVLHKISDGPLDGYFIPRLEHVVDNHQSINDMMDGHDWYGFYGGMINGPQLGGDIVETTDPFEKLSGNILLARFEEYPLAYVQNDAIFLGPQARINYWDTLDEMDEWVCSNG